MTHAAMTFLGLVELELAEAQGVILPIPYEATTSYGKGTAQAPQALIEASAYVELYDEVRDSEPAARSGSSVGTETDSEVISKYWTSAPVDIVEALEPAMTAIFQRAKELVDPSRFLCSIGGEHSITGPLVKAHLAHFPDLHVLQIDAHADLRDQYEGSPLSHASAMARVVDQVENRLTQVGIRSICAEDRQAMRERRLHTFFAQGLRGKPAASWIQEVIDTLGPQVYLTVDVDGLDPAVIPSTGTPEPGGLTWWEAVELIRAVGSQRQLVGADITELAVTGDREGDRRSAFTAAKLTYQIMAAASV